MSESEKEKKPDLISYNTVPATPEPRPPEGAKRIWLRFVGNNPKWGRQAEQEIRAIFDRALKYAFEVFADRVGVSYTHLRFIYDGKRLDASMSANYYGMEDGDQIDVFQEQYGGEAI